MTRPLRFCMATTFYPPWSFGGDAIQVRRLARALAARGHEVTVVHSGEGYAAMAGGPPAGAEEDDPGIRVLRVDAGAGSLSPLATYLTGRPLMAGRRLAAALDAPFDVIHFHNPSLLGGPVALQLGAGLKLYTAHEQWLVCPTHVLWKYQRRVCEKPDCWRCTLSYSRPPQLWRSTRLLERSVSHLDALICPSATSAHLHGRFAPLVRVERLAHFLPDPGEGSDPPAGGPSPAAGGERPYFLYAGRLESIKGVDALLRAFRSPRRGDEELVIAGTGTLEDELRGQAAGLPNVRFVGWQSPAALDALYRGALAVVVPTAGHESFGLVAVEAFARAAPVIARDFGALGELIEDGGGALGFKTDEQLGDALERLARDPALRERLGRDGRAAYEARYGERRHIGAYLDLIARLAKERGDERLAEHAAGAASEERAAL
jgi:glycosyltransferase involved in cell wall biosynthesis